MPYELRVPADQVAAVKERVKREGLKVLPLQEAKDGEAHQCLMPDERRNLVVEAANTIMDAVVNGKASDWEANKAFHRLQEVAGAEDLCARGVVEACQEMQQLFEAWERQSPEQEVKTGK